MLTVDDIRAVPLFASVAEDDLSALALTSGDVRLRTGEYAVHEGGEAALFVVLSGKVEVIKVVNGSERRLGFRQPGSIFGEVPIALGTPFPGAYRAVEPTRVMRVGLRQYYTLAAASPEVSLGLGALARERIGGLQHIFAEPPKARLSLVGHRFDPACGAMRRFLERNQIIFDWLEADASFSPEDYPAVRLEDETVLRRPSHREVANRLGLQTVPSAPEYDTVIIGGGPAGLAAAVYGASEGLRTLVIEREAPGGQAGTSSKIENYLGFPGGVSGDELARRALQQARRLGAEIVVTRVVPELDPGARRVLLDDGDSVRARTMILATGVEWRRLTVDGAERLIGKGVYYGAARSETGSTQGLDIHLIGAGNSAGQAALHFADHARRVTLVVRGDSLAKSMSHYLIEELRAKPNIDVLLSSEVVTVLGDAQLTDIEIRDTRSGAVTRHGCGGLFVFIGARAETAWLPAEIARDANGYILTGDDVVRAGRWSEQRDPYLLESSVPGIFACGDVRLSPVKRVAAAVGEGSMAIALIHQYLRHAQ